VHKPASLSELDVMFFHSIGGHVLRKPIEIVRAWRWLVQVMRWWIPPPRSWVPVRSATATAPCCLRLQRLLVLTQSTWASRGTSKATSRAVSTRPLLLAQMCWSRLVSSYILLHTPAPCAEASAFIWSTVWIVAVYVL